MKFIHLADVHLGAVPDKGYAWSERREEEIWDTFRRVIANIRENPVDLLFIAGDLFHRQPLRKDLNEVNSLFSTIPQTRIYLSAGSHDYMRKDSHYRTFSWVENVTFFGEEEVTCVKDPVLPVSVYGYSYYHPEMKFARLQGIRPEKTDGLHILMAYGGDEKHVPMDVHALMRAGFDYVALGRMHTPTVVARDRMAYSGALEPIDFRELGPHGYMLGDTSGGKLHVQFVPFASRSYHQVVLSVTPETTQKDLEEQARAYIAENGEQNIYHIILQGKRTPGVLLIPEKLKKFGQVLEVVDETYPAYDLERLAEQYRDTLVGDYIRRICQKELTHTEEKALFYGLQALLETSR